MTAGRIWLTSLATLTAAALTVYALANPLAFALIVGVAVWFAGVVGGIAAVGAWAEERRGRLAAEAESERLERELAERDRELKAVERERIAQAIEARAPGWGFADGVARDAWIRAAETARNPDRTVDQ